MDINTNTMTASQPSFGMPVYGAASTVAACFGDLATARVRQLDGIAVEAGVAHVTTAAGVRAAEAVKGDFPGNPAWRPPTC